MSWLWIVVVLFLVLMGLAGYRKGAVKMMLVLGAIVGALVIAAFTGPAVKRLVCENSQLDEKFSEKIEVKMTESIAEEADIENKINNSHLPKFIKNIVLANIKGTNDAFEVGIRKGSAAVANMILVIAFTLIMFVAAWAVTELIVRQLVKTLKLPVLKQLDGIAGVLVSLIIAIVVIDIFFLLLDCVSMTKSGAYLMGLVTRSRLLSALYDKNVVEMVLNTFVGELNV